MKNLLRASLLGLTLLSGLSVQATTLNFYNISEPEYIDPALARGTYEMHPVMALFEGLVEYDPKTLTPIPAVAKSWTISPDGKTYTFHLRSDAKWSDGTPVTAQDFIYSWERVLNPKTAAEYAFQLFNIKNAEVYNQGKITDITQVGFKATDDHTLVVTLNQPTPYFLFQTAFMTMRPTPRQAVEKFGPRWTLPENIVSNGPFVLKKWAPHSELIVEKNPQHWDAKNVALDGIRFVPMDDKGTALKEYLNGNLDILWDVPFVQQSALMERTDSVKAPYLATLFLRFNTKRPPLDNILVRQAIFQAIDRTTLANKYLNGAGKPATSMVPANMLAGYNPPAAAKFDADAARAALQASGVAPDVFAKMSLHYNSDDMNKVAMQVIQQMLQKNLGIQMSLYNEEWKTFLKTQQEMNYDITRSRWIGDYPDPMTFLDLWTSDNAMNETGWKNAAYDNLINKARQEANPPKRLQYLHSAEAILMKELPVIPLYTLQKIMLVSPKVGGFYPNSMDTHPPKFWTLSTPESIDFWQLMQKQWTRS